GVRAPAGPGPARPAGGGQLAEPLERADRGAARVVSPRRRAGPLAAPDDRGLWRGHRGGDRAAARGAAGRDGRGRGARRRARQGVQPRPDRRAAPAGGPWMTGAAAAAVAVLLALGVVVVQYAVLPRWLRVGVVRLVRRFPSSRHTEQSLAGALLVPL